MLTAYLPVLSTVGRVNGDTGRGGVWAVDGEVAVADVVARVAGCIIGLHLDPTTAGRIVGNGPGICPIVGLTSGNGRPGGTTVGGVVEVYGGDTHIVCGVPSDVVLSAYLPVLSTVGRVNGDTGRGGVRTVDGEVAVADVVARIPGCIIGLHLDPTSAGRIVGNGPGICPIVGLTSGNGLPSGTPIGGVVEVYGGDTHIVCGIPSDVLLSACLPALPTIR